MADLEVFELSREIIRFHVIQNKANLAVLRVNGDNVIWSAVAAYGNPKVFEQLFDGIDDPRMTAILTEEIASLGLLTASFDPEILLYYPAISAAIHAERSAGSFNYLYHSEYQEYTRSILSSIAKIAVCTVTKS